MNPSKCRGNSKRTASASASASTSTPSTSSHYRSPRGGGGGSPAAAPRKKNSVKLKFLRFLRDFAISYRAFDDFGGETYLPLVSDWDLSAAFLSASQPDLQLVIEPKNIALDDESWDVVQSTEVIREPSQTLPHLTAAQEQERSVNQLRSGATAQNTNNPSKNETSFGLPQSAKVLSAMTQIGGQYPINLNSKINTAGIFNTMEKWVQKAKTFVEDLSVVTTRPPLSDVEFRNYLDPGGILKHPRELRYACYHGGIEPGLRKVVWKHLLNIYPDGLSGNARMEYVRGKSREYYELRDAWKCGVQNGQVSEDILCVSNMVRKDVLRTDRHLQFFAGQDDNQNIGLLFNILTTYALNHPSVGYCQGMSDLASPLLNVLGDEAQAYICFCALMDRIKPNFSMDGLAMSLKFSHLAEAVAYYDGEFWSYLKTIGADDLLFCYRWLLLEMKREFAFEDALRMMEVLWSSLPYKPQDVPLYEVKFTVFNEYSNPIPVPHHSNLTGSYSRVCAIRRSSTSIGAHAQNELRGRRISRKPKPNPLSLDENSITSMSSIESSIGSCKSHTKPFYSLDETTEILTSSDFSASPFEIYSFCGSSSLPAATSVGATSAEAVTGDQHAFDADPDAEDKPRMIKDLKEFWRIGKLASPDSTPFSSKSSTVSNFDLLLQLQQHPEVNGGFPDEESASEGHSKNCSTTSTTKGNCTTNTTPASATTAETNLTNEGAGDTVTSTAAATLSRMIPILDSAERRSQVSTANSEHDSGHCYGDSLELFESSLPEEPEFSSNQKGAAAAAAAKRASKVKMPLPDVFGGGVRIFIVFVARRVWRVMSNFVKLYAIFQNPFLMFLCVTLLLQHRDHIIRNQMDYNETAMYFDKMIRKHNVGRVLAYARMMYSEYLKQNVARV